jgi:hypothetical protein
MKTARNNLFRQTACRYNRSVALVLGAVLIFASPCSGQAPASTNNGSQLPRRIPPPTQVDDARIDNPSTSIFYERRLQAMNAAQHQSMVADTDRLLKLIADLNEQINSSNAHSLTPQQQRMVAEIEKLAHSVRDKMRMTVRSAENGDFGADSPFPPR